MAVKNRLFLNVFLFLAAICSSLHSNFSSATQPKVVTPNVTYIGMHSALNTQVNQFIGIPFAHPPINDLRWRAPQPFQHKSKTYQANKFKPACYQDSYNIDWYKSVALYFDHQLDMVMPKVSEDCLYLNIWSPITPKAKRPVMVWIHGGSNKSGWAYEPNYLGDNLAVKGDVIVVSIAYRLGVFGFLAHPELSTQKAQTNFGLLDQIQALKWLQENIEYFGGDINNITVFGESAGAANISYLMSTPLAKGLFNKAISQSSGFQLFTDNDLEQGMKFGQKLSLLTNALSIDELRKTDTNIIWQASKKVDPKYDYRMLVDGHFTSKSLIPSLVENADIDLMIGTNQHEYYMYQNDEVSTLSIHEAAVSPSLATKLTQEAAKLKNIKLAQDWLDTFIYMSCPSLKLAELAANNSRNVWLYRFDRIREGGDNIKAYHGAEIPYVFDTHDHWLPTNISDKELTDYMLSAWTNFAKYGAPNTKTTTKKWLKFNHHPQQILSLNASINMIDNKQWPLCQQLWQDYPALHK